MRGVDTTGARRQKGGIMSRIIIKADVELELENEREYRALAARRDELVSILMLAQAETESARRYLDSGEYACGCESEGEEWEAYESADWGLACAEMHEKYVSAQLESLNARLERL